MSADYAKEHKVALHIAAKRVSAENPELASAHFNTRPVEFNGEDN